MENLQKNARGARKFSAAKCLATGALAGAANGLFGAGGGMFVIPLYTKWVGIDERRAFANSVAVILPISIVSAVVYFARGGMELRSAAPYLLGGVVGGAVGGRIFKQIPTAVLRRVFAILLIYGGIRSVMG